MDIVYDVPNEETAAAIKEAKGGDKLESLDMKEFDEYVASL